MKKPPSVLLRLISVRRQLDPHKLGMILKKRIPGAIGKRCMESMGWLITVGKDKGGRSVLHPFSDVHIQLPHQNTTEHYRSNKTSEPWTFISKAILPANPSHTSDFSWSLRETSSYSVYGDREICYGPGLGCRPTTNILVMWNISVTTIMRSLMAVASKFVMSLALTAKNSKTSRISNSSCDSSPCTDNRVPERRFAGLA